MKIIKYNLSKPRTDRLSLYGGQPIECVDTAEFYRVNVFYRTIDHILSDLNVRLGEKQKLPAQLSCVIPSTWSSEMVMMMKVINANSWKEVSLYQSFLSDPLSVLNLGINCLIIQFVVPSSNSEQMLLLRRMWKSKFWFPFTFIFARCNNERSL